MVIFRRDFEADINVDTDIQGVDKREISKLEDSYDNIRAEIQKISEEYTDVIDVSKIDDQLIDTLTTTLQEEINKELAIATRSQTFGEPEYESGIIEDLGQEVDITVSIIPKTEDEIALARIDIDEDKFKSESKELIADGMTGLLAEERFDISKLKELPSGVSRNVYDLGDHAVLKVLKTSGGTLQTISNVAQQVAEGLHEDFPTVYERGLDYVVVEKVTIDKDRAEKLLKPVSDIYNSALFGDLYGIDPTELEVKIKEGIKKIDEETGGNLSAIFQFPSTTASDILDTDFSQKAGENVGFRGDIPVIVDPGTITLSDPEEFLETFAEGAEGAKKLVEEIDKRRTELTATRRTAMPVKEKQRKVDKMIVQLRRFIGDEQTDKYLAGELDVTDIEPAGIALANQITVNILEIEEDKGKPTPEPEAPKSILDTAIERIEEEFEQEEIVSDPIAQADVVEVLGQTIDLQRGVVEQKIADTGDPNIPEAAFLRGGQEFLEIETDKFERREHFRLREAQRKIALTIVKEVMKNTNIQIKYLSLQNIAVETNSLISDAVTKIMEHYVGILGSIIGAEASV